MGLDILTLAMAKSYSDSKGGYTEPLTASFVAPASEDITADVTLMGIDFKWFSSITPTKEEFLAGKLTSRNDGREITADISTLEPNVVAEAAGAYCVMVGGMWFVVSTVLENELGTLPKTGIYYSTSGSGGGQLDAGARITLDFGERIVPIDQKYLYEGYEKTMLYDGAPAKMDLSAAGMGYAYLLSSEDLFTRACGQNVHFEYTLASGATAHGVLNKYGYMAELSTPMVYGAFTLLYAPTLGGTGVSFNYADIGEITNLKLWTEYSEGKPYYVTGYYNGTTTVFFPVELEKATVAAFAMHLMVRYLDAGGNLDYYTPTEASEIAGDLRITVTKGDLTVQNGNISGW